MVENCPKLLILVLFDSKSKKFIDVVQVKNLRPFLKRIRYVTYWYNKNGPLQQYLKKKIKSELQNNPKIVDLSNDGKKIVEKVLRKKHLKQIK